MAKTVNLKKVREQLGLERKDVAEMAGVDLSTICRWENGGVPSRGAAKAFVDRLAGQAREAAQ